MVRRGEGSARGGAQGPGSFTYSLLSILTMAPPYSGSRTLSPSLTLTGMSAPSRVWRPGPTATTTPSFTCGGGGFGRAGGEAAAAAGVSCGAAFARASRRRAAPPIDRQIGLGAGAHALVLVVLFGRRRESRERESARATSRPLNAPWAPRSPAGARRPRSWSARRRARPARDPGAG